MKLQMQVKNINEEIWLINYFEKVIYLQCFGKTFLNGFPNASLREIHELLLPA